MVWEVLWFVLKYEILNRTGSSFCFEMFAGVERFCDFVLKKMGEKDKIKAKKERGTRKKNLLLHFFKVFKLLKRIVSSETTVFPWIMSSLI